MNTVLILFLTIVIIFAIWYAASSILADYLIKNSTSLNTASKSTRPSIESSLLDNPGSSRYYYEGWFFIAGNQKINQENIIFNRGSDFVVTLNGSALNLYVNGGTVADVGTFNPAGATKLISVPNFPFQRWALLVINVDGMSVDLYIDGKFVQNTMSPVTINSNADNAITYGNKFIIGHVARFKRPSASINPQGVWNDFLKGSGQGQSLTDNHLNVIVTNKQKTTLDKRIF
jgi:hypothetical protein